MMNNHKEREAFEQHLTDTGLVEFAGYGFAVDECDEYLHEPTQVAWDSWLIGLNRTKAQAVPETQQALNDRLLVKSIREHVESHIAEISVNDLFDKGWLAAMKCIQNNIDMLEAQEPAKAQAVPEGFVLMPKEPTDEIIEAMNEFDYRNDYSDMDGAYRTIVETLEKAQAVPDQLDVNSILHDIDCYFDNGLSNTERTANNLLQSIYEKLSGEVKAQEPTK